MRVQYKHTNCDDLYLSEAQEGNEKKEDEAEGGRDAGVLEEFRVTSSSGCGHVIAGCAEVFVTTEIIKHPVNLDLFNISHSNSSFHDC